jgi:GMP synthase-like glutamine amidotransferase
MILIINVCKEKLHYFEFMKPIEKILSDNKIKFKSKHYGEIKEDDMKSFDKIIICGTSLKDNQFLNNIDKFSWIKKTDKKILGICAGMQIISIIFGGKIKKHNEIGFFHENFENQFLGLTGEQEVYHLHNNYVQTNKNFEIYSSNKIPQAIKHKDKEIYGVLFHPEVRQKNMILEFAK